MIDHHLHRFMREQIRERVVAMFDLVELQLPRAVRRHPVRLQGVDGEFQSMVEIAITGPVERVHGDHDRALVRDKPKRENGLQTHARTLVHNGRFN